jgi:hypothetical protein
MNFKLLSSIAIPAVLAIGTAVAQEAPTPPRQPRLRR